jgi:flavin reductase (DIM6/NTAB) family NADH-FMN oxidoreductase RutF
MAIQADTFKAIMSRWASGVSVVTCRRDDGIHGMTASSFTSVSLSPPLILICVDRRNRTHQYIQEQRAFGVHLLARDAEETSNRCAGFRGEEGNWLLDVAHRTEVTGAPILDECLAWMDCSLWAAYDGGDHSIFVGQIEAGGVSDGEPLLWYSRGYAGLVR